MEELSNHLDPSRRNVIVGVAGRTARSMWAALQTELQIQDDMDIVLMAHPVRGRLAILGSGIDGKMENDPSNVVGSVLVRLQSLETIWSCIE